MRYNVNAIQCLWLLGDCHRMWGTGGLIYNAHTITKQAWLSSLQPQQGLWEDWAIDLEEFDENKWRRVWYWNWQVSPKAGAKQSNSSGTWKLVRVTKARSGTLIRTLRKVAVTGFIGFDWGKQKTISVTLWIFKLNWKWLKYKNDLYSGSILDPSWFCMSETT